MSQGAINDLEKKLGGQIKNLRAQIKELQGEFKEVSKSNKTMKAEIKAYDSQFKDLNEMYHGMEDRVLVAEKLLKFTEIQKDKMDEEQREVKYRGIIDEAFKPTHQRVLELQSKMGELSRVYID